MRRSTLVVIIVLIVGLTSIADANVGRFSSYSTTAMRSPGQLQLSVIVGTTGLELIGPATASDYVFVLAYAMPTTGTGSGTTTAYISRTALGAGAFTGSFSITGLDDNVNYKWATLTFGSFYGTYGPTFFNVFVIPYYYLYYGCLPPTTPLTQFLLTTQALTTTTPTWRSVICTTTPTGGPLYDFVNSDINSFNATLNWWYSNGTTIYPLWANAASGGFAPLLSAIPTLASWGLMVLGTLMALTGVILSRRT